MKKLILGAALAALATITFSGCATSGTSINSDITDKGSSGIKNHELELLSKLNQSPPTVYTQKEHFYDNEYVLMLSDNKTEVVNFYTTEKIAGVTYEINNNINLKKVGDYINLFQAISVIKEKRVESSLEIIPKFDFVAKENRVVKIEQCSDKFNYQIVKSEINTHYHTTDFQFNINSNEYDREFNKLKKGYIKEVSVCQLQNKEGIYFIKSNLGIYYPLANR